MAASEQVLLASALHRLELLQKAEAFDPHDLASRPTAKQQEVIDDFGHIRQQWIRAGNQSGKSATCARIVSWFITEFSSVVPARRSHEDPRQRWNEEPLLVIVAGRTGKQIEDSLLPKIRGFLEPGTYKEVRIGNIIQRLELTNGNRIIFQSLENPAVARERLMSYVAHMVWIDELPPTMDIVRELLVRVQARDGYFMASFTPTIVASEIQKYVDSLTLPEGKVYRFHMLDNPLYQNPERAAQLLARYAHLPTHMQEAVFRGEWLSTDDSVYYFSYDSMVATPQGYSRLWRHVEAVDPALKSALGLTLWAEDPATGIWYCVLAKYVKGIYVPTELVKHVHELTKDFNVVRRVADPHEVWYIQTASSMGIPYIGVYKKGERKSELIKQFQEFLGSRIRICPSETDLLSEIQECRWSDRAEGKIVNASSYHLLDSSQYFCDNIPAREANIQASSWQDWLYKANEKRIVTKEKEKAKLERVRIRRRGR